MNLFSFKKIRKINNDTQSNKLEKQLAITIESRLIVQKL